jgi:hypothetical protein
MRLSTHFSFFTKEMFHQKVLDAKSVPKNYPQHQFSTTSTHLQTLANPLASPFSIL